MVHQVNARLGCLSVVHYRVDLAEMLYRGRDYLLNGLFVGTFCNYMHNINAVLFLQTGLRIDKALLVAAGDAQVRALFSERAGNAEADTLAAARNDRNISFKKSHNGPLSLQQVFCATQC